MDLLQKNLTTRDIVTKQCLINAAIVVSASGGSTNAGLHLPAIAHEAGIDFNLEDVTKILYDWDKNNINNFSLEDIFNNDFYKGYFNNLLKLNPSIIHNELGGIC